MCFVVSKLFKKKFILSKFKCERDRNLPNKFIISDKTNSLSVILYKEINVTVGSDKPLVRLIVVRPLSVEKGQVLWSELMDTSFSLRVLPLKNGLTQELKNCKTGVLQITWGSV